MKASYFSEQFASGLPYDRYLLTGTGEQQRRWSQVYDAAQLTDAQKQLVGGFVRGMKILIFSGIWCGDCVEQCPLIQRIAQANTRKIELRFIERPKEAELAPELRINGGAVQVSLDDKATPSSPGVEPERPASGESVRALDILLDGVEARVRSRGRAGDQR